MSSVVETSLNVLVLGKIGSKRFLDFARNNKSTCSPTDVTIQTLSFVIRHSTFGLRHSANKFSSSHAEQPGDMALLLNGFILGWSVSWPPGPVNAEMIRRGLLPEKDGGGFW